MRCSVARVVCLGLFFASSSVAAEAQELAGSLEQLRVLVKAGDTVSVTDRTGREMRGTISELSSSALALDVAGSRRTLLESDITAIRQRRSDSLANGARWGFAVGAGLGLLAGLQFAAEYEDGSSALIPVLALVYGGVGAGTGAGLDAMVAGSHVIYARRGDPSKVSLRPILTPSRKGILATVTLTR